MDRRRICGDYQKALQVLVLYFLTIERIASAAARGVASPSWARTSGNSRLEGLVEEPQVLLDYYYGPLLSGPDPIPIYIIWYGNFSHSQRTIVQDFFASFNTSTAVYEQTKYPTVQGWWNLTAGYVDADGNGVNPLVYLAGELDNPCLLGKSLTEDDIEQLVLNSISGAVFAANYSAAYFVLTAADVEVDTFCMDVCGSHHSTYPSGVTGGQQLPYAWAGNSANRCPGMCAWPYARALYGPPSVLKAPSGDVGMDGMIINLAALLAGMATNPYGTGYYQGDAVTPLEAATACMGVYGPNAFPGNPGLLFVNPATNASFNAVGVTGREFLLPAIWLPSNQSCTPPPYYY